MIMNGFGDFGTKEYSLFGARNLTGPWAKIHSGELNEGKEMTEEVMFYACTNIIICLKYFTEQDVDCCKRLHEYQTKTTTMQETETTSFTTSTEATVTTTASVMQTTKDPSVR